MASKEIRDSLFERQGGRSPLSGKPLNGGRLEIHHIRELYEGGSGEIGNLQLVTMAEHLAEHYRRSKDSSRSAGDRLRELDTVLGRISELTGGERRELSEAIWEQVGVRVWFV